MAEVECKHKQAARLMRCSARAVTLVWATCWIFLLGTIGMDALRVFPQGVLLASFILLLSTAIAWRWEIIGAVVLVSEGLLMLPFVYRVITVGHFPVPDHFPYTVIFPLLLLAVNLSPLIAGFLFLASWARSRKPK